MNNINLPTTIELEELLKEEYKFKYRLILKSILNTLIIVIALSIIISNTFISIFKIYGNSMYPNIDNKDIVVSINKSKFKRGDVISFYYNNKILVKRVIATSLEWVNIDEYGNVYINNKLLDESYIDKKYLGNKDIEFPYQIPEDSYFVLGDNRETSIDSRNSIIGSIKSDDIIGKVIFRLYPIDNIGLIN